MDQKIVAIFTIICLLIGIVGIISTVVTAQTIYILLLPLLAIYLFFVTNKEALDAYYGPRGAFWLTILRHLFFFVLGLGFAFYLGETALSGTQIYIIPIYMVFLTIGLFYSSRLFNRN